MCTLNYFKVVITFLLLFVINDSFANRSCSKHDDKTCQESETNKYSKGLLWSLSWFLFLSYSHFLEANSKYKKYIKFVEDARKTYIPCKQANCSCHSNVISGDLSIFKNGITEKLIKNIASK